VEELYDRANVILKVKEPLYNGEKNKHEIDMMKENTVLISFLHPASPSNHEMIKKLRDRKIISFTMDSIPRITRAQKMDALTSMSTVAGYKSVIMAANWFPKFIPMTMTAAGMIEPAKFLIIGTGIVGLQAIATAKRLGGVVSAVDIRPDAREQAASVGAKVVGFDVPPDLAIGEGGYARALPEEWLERERQALAPLVKDSDIVISGALVPGERAPILITEEMVAGMKKGSIICDVAVDQGGNCSLTEHGKQVWEHGVFISGIANIPGSMPRDATTLYANNVSNYLDLLIKAKEIKIDLEDEIVKKALVTIDGEIVHQGTLKAMEEVK
jgi:NAD(P) transhydrogenase subunit alpha